MAFYNLGSIPFLNFEEKLNNFTAYYELLMQIILKILCYRGGYISRINYEISTMD